MTRHTPYLIITLFMAIAMFLILGIEEHSATSTDTSSTRNFGYIRNVTTGKIRVAEEHPLEKEVQPENKPDAKTVKIAQWISEKYDIAIEKSTHIVQVAFETGLEIGVDPLLILAVICVESRFIETIDKNNGVGLMQIVPKWHAERIKDMRNARSILKDIDTNIRIGGFILKDYLRLAKNNTAKALQMYNGSTHDPRRRYSGKVIERHRVLNQLAAL